MHASRGSKEKSHPGFTHTLGLSNSPPDTMLACSSKKVDTPTHLFPPVSQTSLSYG